VWKEAEKLIKHNKVDRLLGRLKEDCPEQVRQWRKNTWRGWMIGPPLAGT